MGHKVGAAAGRPFTPVDSLVRRSIRCPTTLGRWLQESCGPSNRPVNPVHCLRFEFGRTRARTRSGPHRWGSDHKMPGQALVRRAPARFLCSGERRLSRDSPLRMASRDRAEAQPPRDPGAQLSCAILRRGQLQRRGRYRHDARKPATTS